MQLGMIGLGRMGANMVRRLIRGGHECVVFDMSQESVSKMASEGAKGSSSLDDFDEIGTQHIGEGLQQNRYQRDHHLPAVGAQILQQPRHQAAVISLA